MHVFFVLFFYFFYFGTSQLHRDLPVLLREYNIISSILNYVNNIIVQGVKYDNEMGMVMIRPMINIDHYIIHGISITNTILIEIVCSHYTLLHEIYSTCRGAGNILCQNRNLQSNQYIIRFID